MTETAVAVRGGMVNIEDQAMSVEGLTGQVQLIQKVMASIMRDGEHFMVIPGTSGKPSLLKPGAEKLCLTFRLGPDYEIMREIRDKDFIAYTVKCTLTHIPSGNPVASGIGSCNSRESKYRWRFIEESTGEPVPKAYWEAKKKGDSKEMKRILGEGMRAAKIEGAWVVSRSEKVENDNPWDLDNTIIKMACKRALVAATLNATAASDIFTQDIEDMEPEAVKAAPKQQAKAAQVDMDTGEILPETIGKEAQQYITSLIKEVDANPGRVVKFCEEHFNKSSSKELTADEASELTNWLLELKRVAE